MCSPLALPRLREDGTRQQRVIAIAGPTAVGWEMPLWTEQAPLGVPTMWACQPIRVEGTFEQSVQRLSSRSSPIGKSIMRL
jgi:hypothetical protein